MLAIGLNFTLALVAVLNAAASTLPPHRLSMLVPYDYIDWNDWFHSREVVVEGGTCDIISSTSDAKDVWTKQQWLDADVVVFYWPSFMYSRVARSAIALPSRPSGKIWVYFNEESPYEPFNDNPYAKNSLNGSINAVMSYDRAATVYAPYGRYAPHKPALDELPGHITPTRPKLAVIVVSNCDAWMRAQQISQLRRHMHVDVLGKCRTITDPVCDRRRPECFTHLAASYLFYLALENSDCEDYVTEKVWRNALDAGMVPIVWSMRVNYTALLPPNSFISISDFKTVKEAANYIQELALHPRQYARYHAWRKHYDVQVATPMDHGRALCRYAHEHKGEELSPVDLFTLRTRKSCSVKQYP